MEALRVDDEVELVPLVVAQSARLFAVVDANRAYLREWLPWVDRTNAVADTTAFLEASVRARDAGAAYGFLIERGHDVCGTIGLNRIDKGNRSADLGYWLAQDAQRQGIVTAACRVLLRFGFASAQLNRVTLGAAVGNERSRRVAERLGFSYEGTSLEAEWVRDRFVDHARYAMLKRDWEQRGA
jgi:ribosomal-protein-serine acetyltransferase